MAARWVRACALALGVASACGAPAWGAGRGEPGEVTPVRVELRDRLEDLRLFAQLDLDVDGVFGAWARLYLLPEEAEKLAALGYALSSTPDGLEGVSDVGPLAGTAAAPGVPNTYHTYETLTTELQKIASDHPGIARLYTLGKSVQGRELWMMKVTRNPDAEEDEPEVRYIAAMHGDEVVGKEMCVNLLNLLTDGYGTDPRITSLVDTSEIWILPSMNPDGTAAARRYNAQNVDLNRDFPDQFTDPVDSTAGRAVETAHVMTWGYAHGTNVSANFHGGAVVANYPYDSTESGLSVYSLSPDDALFRSLSRTYADANPAMASSNADPSFDRGICNGSDWYVIHGGMQDWNYVWRGGRELTLEISAVKWPSGSSLPGYWDDNRESMLALLERAGEGVRGLVTDATTGAPLAATVRVVGLDGNGSATYSDPQVGDYHRPLLPGRYDLEIGAAGYATARVADVVVTGGPAVRRDAALTPLAVELQAIAATVLDGADGALGAGEAADLALTVKDLGSAATAVSGVLEPTGFDALVLRGEAAYPDLAAGATGTSAAPHHRVQAAADAPPGRRAGFVLRWTSAEGTGASDPFWVPLGAPSCTTVGSTDVPRAVPDRSTVESTLSFPSSFAISSADVYVDVGHTYAGDLHVSVVSPAGTPVALHSRSGGSTDDVVGWFDDERAPSESLSRLHGEQAAGTWRLRVNDGVPSNTGSIRQWSVRLCGRPFETSTPEIRLAGVAKRDGSVALSWWPYPGLTSYRVYRADAPGSRSGFTDVTASDDDATDLGFSEPLPGESHYYLVTGVGPNGEGPR
jgi:subtilisin-like proprotein convertase family protein